LFPGGLRDRTGVIGGFGEIFPLKIGVVLSGDLEIFTP